MSAGDQPVASQADGKDLATKIPTNARTVEKSGPSSENTAKAIVRGTAGSNYISVFDHSECPIRDSECHTVRHWWKYSRGSLWSPVQ